MREIRINVGINLDEAGIKKVLTPCSLDGDETGPLQKVAEALMIERLDNRAEVHEIVIEDVFIDPEFPSQVTINFTSSWSLYVGCRDMNGSGVEDECETATYTDDGFLTFRVPVQGRDHNPC